MDIDFEHDVAVDHKVAVKDPMLTSSDLGYWSSLAVVEEVDPLEKTAFGDVFVERLACDKGIGVERFAWARVASGPAS